MDVETRFVLVLTVKAEIVAPQRPRRQMPGCRNPNVGGNHIKPLNDLTLSDSLQPYLASDHEDSSEGSRVD